MKPLIYFSYGMTKCGTTLAFHMVSEALSQAGYEQHRLPESLIGPNKKLNFGQHFTDDQADELWEFVQTIGHPIVIKTHTRPDPSVVRLIQNGQAIAHACYRDPRDMALSMLDHGKRARAQGNPAFAEIQTLEDAKSGIRNQCDSLTAWLRLPKVLPLDFEDIAFDMQATAQRILNQLDISGDPEKIVNKVLDGRFTQFNKGISQRYKSEMPDQDDRDLAHEFAPLLTRLIDRKPNLPTDGSIVLPPPNELRI
ncbi:MAG: sulfotransferase domain-containing protein [Rhodobacteraceae bacterium]|nr:sulfotransferase domain-containing protein [Paracoccaceae bacterium]